MKPKDNGYNDPNLSSGQQNPQPWWQTSGNSTSQSTGLGQLSDQAQSLQSNPIAQPGLTNSAPAQASDSDLVENEWVDAVKKIMVTYRTDPYNKNRALTLLRADYMKKRYNKDIKVPEN